MYFCLFSILIKCLKGLNSQRSLSVSKKWPSVSDRGGIEFPGQLNMSGIIEGSDTNRTKSDSNILIYNRVPKCASSTMKALLSRLIIDNIISIVDAPPVVVDIPNNLDTQGIFLRTDFGVTVRTSAIIISKNRFTDLKTVCQPSASSRCDCRHKFCGRQRAK